MQLTTKGYDMTQRTPHHILDECRMANRIENNVIITTCVSERDPIVVVTDTIIIYFIPTYMCVLCIHNVTLIASL